jgi:hypothetical protein
LASMLSLPLRQARFASTQLRLMTVTAAMVAA